MAGLATPRKDFRYLLELDGADAFLIQEIETPEVELPIVEHAAPGNIPNAKTPGKMKVGNLVVKKLKPANRVDTWAWDMMVKAANGLTPDFAKTGFLKHMDTEMARPLETFFLGSTWITKISSSGLKGQGSENIIETCEFAVQFYFSTSSDEFQAYFGGSAAAAAGQAFNAGRP